MRMDDEMARAVIEEELRKQLKYKSKLKHSCKARRVLDGRSMFVN